ncbi:Crp/Fnr family transcriptional regulator [Parapedobacter koreensis]|uniref:cAMP-binding domain of CRP or a regulatory subunit of cAMP-dependent protein kinases n=1 Tax=Parapedobacter koreensis TaxID=332977 RepID=A0A1H7Q919_9SPHI|nr:Crp/Fnr family transcriptional regulator [Parapedobacter koreensis]SEL44472.1 cAMP-binding domain of CRP or a regulatory subunit of cAMP-dependent protein kinases [Parapedobacter koreensis]
MSEPHEILHQHLMSFAALTPNDIIESQTYWKTRTIKKGDFFNMQNVVCNDLGLVLKGIFRIYYNDPVTDEQKNIFFISENQFIVSFRSFITRYPCAYFIEAMEDSEIIYITYRDLNHLYDTYHGWSKFGRLLAELFFNYSQARAEEFLFNSHEERYVKLLEEHPDIVNRIPAYHISSYLGITNPSLSRIRKRINR